MKGYEVSKGQHILLTNDEINSVKLESTKTIEIERFVPGDEIDRLYWNNPYFLAPDGKLAQEAFGVIRTAMEKSGQIALGRVVIGPRERILALEPRDKGSRRRRLSDKRSWPPWPERRPPSLTGPEGNLAGTKAEPFAVSRARSDGACLAGRGDACSLHQARHNI